VTTTRRGQSQRSGGRAGSNEPAPDEADITAFADHEVIVPRHNLKRHARRMAAGVEIDLEAIERAEAAMGDIVTEFAGWMQTDCERLETNRASFLRDPGPKTRDALYRASHDLRGQAATFGFPHAGSAADSLCRLLDGLADPPAILIDQHVAAIRAIVREAGRPQSPDIAQRLVEALSSGVKEALVARRAALPG
jgi:chemotaxis protein histidine kinase CheA